MANELNVFDFTHVSDKTIDNVLDEIEKTEKQLELRSNLAHSIVSPRTTKDDKFVPYYFNDMNKFSVAWSQHNRNGFIQLTISENCLCEDLIIPKIKSSQSKIEITSDTLYYKPGLYFEPLQKCLSGFVDEYIMSAENDYKLKANQIIIGAGLTIMFPVLMYVICQPDSIVLVPSPFFSGFSIDLQILGTKIQLVSIPTKESNNYDVELLELNKLYARYGRRIRAFLFTSPNNPTGKVYSKQQIQLMYNWCNDKHIHFIADEIYALSPNTQQSKFISCLDVVENIEKSKYFHWIYGMSKDFSLSGFRIGFFYTENKHIREGVRKYHMQYNVPFHTQQLIYHMLSDVKWVEGFLTENKRRLIRKYNLWCAGLSECDIPYFKAEYGLFVWINLSEWFEKIWKKVNVKSKGGFFLQCNKIEKLFEWEKLFYFELMKEKRLSIAPGRCFGATQPGFYRICFAAVTDETIIMDSIERLKDMLDMETFVKKIIANNELGMLQRAHTLPHDMHINNDILYDKLEDKEIEYKVSNSAKETQLMKYCMIEEVKNNDNTDDMVDEIKIIKQDIAKLMSIQINATDETTIQTLKYEKQMLLPQESQTRSM